ncbi:outer membrane beta-barrel protein [Paraflavitalea pollutisoli]|uniref:outer membrane beta-barrel protein n=1 Tax=Paraflavitalea pollutisoli TaxID=3034143 RepID=UPI0023EDEB82|nr:outer membrane beta-barrel protein [Paraflavitalea sp. H1-2-19X]
MNHFQRVFAICCLMIISLYTFAQDGSGSKFYLKAAGGYFFSVSNGQFPNVGPYPPHDVSAAVNPTTGVSTTLRDKVLTGSYGQGVRGGLSIGYNINKYFAVEGTFNYYHSKKNLMTRNVSTIQGTSTVVGSIESNGHVNAVDFAPSLVLSPGYTKLNPYMRFGVVVPLWGRLIIETDATRTSAVPNQPPVVVAQTVIHREEEIKPYPTIGFQGAIGATYALNSRFDLFVEAEYRNVPVKSHSKEITTYNEVTKFVNTANGQEVAPQRTRGLNDLNVAERNTDYVTTIDQNSNTPTGTSGTTTNYKDNNKPANDFISFINIGGLGVNLGVRLRLR